MKRNLQTKLAVIALAVRKKAGKVLLTDDELVVLACDEIARSVSYEEKNYSSEKTC